MSEMACAELVEVVTDYLEDALPEADRRRFEAHLEECPFCTEYLAQMRATVDRLGRGEPAPLPPAIRDALLRAFRDRPGAA